MGLILKNQIKAGSDPPDPSGSLLSAASPLFHGQDQSSFIDPHRHRTPGIFPKFFSATQIPLP